MKQFSNNSHSSSSDAETSKMSVEGKAGKEIAGAPKTARFLPVTVFVQQQDADITIDGKTVNAGQAVKLSEGSHRLQISKEGFKTKQEDINVSEKNVVFNYTLAEVELQPVHIKSVPPGAQIFLDGMEKGITDKDVWLYPGIYDLKLIMPGYLEINKSISVTEGNPEGSAEVSNIFSYNLIKNSGTLNLNVIPNDANVLINKEEYSSAGSDNGRINIELAQGRYKIELSKSGYNPISETISIVRDKTLSKAYSLTPKTGKLQFSIQPLDGRVILKQSGRDVQRWTGMRYIKDLPVGDYELECTADGYSGKSKRITINEGQTAVLDIRLDKTIGTTTMTDQDGNVYKTVKIGNQEWMAENLRVTHYRNGDPIPNVTKCFEWAVLRRGACCAYDNDKSKVETYGLLYNWYAVNDRRNIAPEGWHVPTDEEWRQLEKHLGSDAGGKLKEGGTEHWASPNEGATNSSGFSALPGGYRYGSGAFYDVGYVADYWSATEYLSGNAWYRTLGYDNSDVDRNGDIEQLGFSVRLVRD